MFRGITEISIDEKGRFAVPTSYRDALTGIDGAPLIVTIDTDETCLLLYPSSEWQLIEQKLQRLPSFNPAARRIQRLLIGHATSVKLDGSGRLLLPSVLRNYAKLSKQAVLVGQCNKFEIWDSELWQARLQTWLEEEASDKSGLPGEMDTFFL